MKNSILFLTIFASQFAHASTLSFENIIDANATYQCTKTEEGVVTGKSEGKLVLVTDAITNLDTKEKLSVLRVHYTRKLGNMDRPIIMNLLLVDSNGIVKNQAIGHIEEDNVTYIGEQYKTWVRNTKQTVKDNSVLLLQGSEDTGTVELSKDSGKIKSFSARQILKERVLGVIPRTISNYLISCVVKN